MKIFLVLLTLLPTLASATDLDDKMAVCIKHKIQFPIRNVASPKLWETGYEYCQAISLAKIQEEYDLHDAAEATKKSNRGN